MCVMFFRPRLHSSDVIIGVAVLGVIGGDGSINAAAENALDGQLRQVWMIFVGNCEYQPAGASPADNRSAVDRGRERIG
jgi:hypothetical protein